MDSTSDSFSKTRAKNQKLYLNYVSLHLKWVSIDRHIDVFYSENNIAIIV